METATTVIYTYGHTLSLLDALPIWPRTPIRCRCCAMTDATLSLTGLRRSFTQAGVTIDVLRGIDGQLHRGEIVALLGPPGSGKSTLFQAVGVLEGGFGGVIRIDGSSEERRVGKELVSRCRSRGSPHN